ncbi:MAG: hypothetical protein ACLUGI_11785 [Subdoligranulum sp.]
MEDVVLIAGTALMFLFGWFLMKRLDRFLDENRKRIEEAPEQQQPEQCVHLAGNISPDELEGNAFPVSQQSCPCRNRDL